MCQTLTAGNAAVAAELNGLTRIPSICLPSDALKCGVQTIWIQQCCVAISTKDHLISTDDLLDLSTTLWDVSGCHTTCPKLVVDLLFADDLASLADRLPGGRMRASPLHH